MKNLSYIILKIFFKNKKNIINTFVICFLILSFFLTVSYYKMSKNYFDYDIYNKMSSFKTLYISNDKIDEENLLNINHVKNVFKEYDYQWSFDIEEFSNNDVDGEFFVYTLGSNNDLELIAGEIPEDGDYMICPDNFYPNGNEDYLIKLNRKSRIDLRGMLGKKYKYTDNLSDEKYITLAGIYKNNSNIIDENICYVSPSIIGDLFINLNKDDEEFDINDYSSYFVEVDEYSNVEKVKMNLESNGYTVEYVSFVNLETFKFIKSQTSRVIIFISAIMLFFVFFMFSKIKKENENELQILRYLGFSSKKIIFINIVELFIKLVFNIIILLTFVGLSYLVIKLLVYEYPFIFAKKQIVFDFNSIFIGLMVVFAIDLVLIMVTYLRTGLDD